ARAMTEDDGFATLLDLDQFGDAPPRLTATPPASRAAQILFASVSPWDLRDTTLRLPRAQSIEGVVRRPDGRPAPAEGWRDGAPDSGRPGDVRRSVATTRADGRFTVSGLRPDERVRLFAASSLAARTTGPVVDAKAGDRDVVLVLPATAGLSI